MKTISSSLKSSSGSLFSKIIAPFDIIDASSINKTKLSDEFFKFSIVSVLAILKNQESIVFADLIPLSLNTDAALPVKARH